MLQMWHSSVTWAWHLCDLSTIANNFYSYNHETGIDVENSILYEK